MAPMTVMLFEEGTELAGGAAAACAVSATVRIAQHLKLLMAGTVGGHRQFITAARRPAVTGHRASAAESPNRPRPETRVTMHKRFSFI